MALDSIEDSKTLACSSAPDWRWRRAILYVSGKKQPTTGQDEHVRAAFHFLKEWRKQPWDKVHELAFKYPEMFYARRIYAEAYGRRWILEGLILGRAPDAISAKAAGITPDAVRMYKKVYWDVEKNIDEPGWLDSRLPPQYAGRGSPSLDLDAYYKRYGLANGWEELLRLIGVSRADPDLFRKMVDTFETDLMKLSMFTVKRVEPNSFNACEILNQGRGMMKDRMAREAAVPSSRPAERLPEDDDLDMDAGNVKLTQPSELDWKVDSSGTLTAVVPEGIVHDPRRPRKKVKSTTGRKAGEEEDDG